MTEKQFIKATPTLYDLVRITVADAKKINIDPKYDWDMSDWHVAAGYEEATCYVCMAGAVIAKTLNYDPNKHGEPCRFKSGVGDRLAMIDDLRRGHVYGGPYKSNQSQRDKLERYIIHDDRRGLIRRGDIHAWELLRDKVKRMGI